MVIVTAETILSSVNTMEVTAAPEKTPIAIIAKGFGATATRLANIDVQVTLAIFVVELICTFVCYPGTCPAGNDHNCDGRNNMPECNYDDGDCCLEITNCNECHGDECICHETGQSHCMGI